MTVRRFLFSYPPLMSKKLQALAFQVSPLASELAPTETKATACLADVVSGSLQTQANMHYRHSGISLCCPVRRQSQASGLLPN